jgi:hypothetical protein
MGSEKHTKGERDCDKLFNEGHSEKDIRTVISWSIQNIPDVHSFGIISSTIGKSLAKTKRIEERPPTNDQQNKIEQEKRVKWEKAATEVDEMDNQTRQNLREEVLELIPIEARALPKGTLEKMIYSRQVDVILERKDRQSGVA